MSLYVCITGNQKLINKRIEALQAQPPPDWRKYDCTDKRFKDNYYWFEYIGNIYPKCLLYVLKQNDDSDKTSFMILPNDERQMEITENESSGIVHSLFDGITDNNIKIMEKLK